MTRVVLVRHAPSEWNREGRWQGWADPPLSAEGRALAARAAGVLGPVSVAVSSDLRRASATAAVLAAPWGVAPSTDPDLREYDAGGWSGLTRPEIEVRWPGALAEWDAGTRLETPGGESIDGFARRVTAGLARAAARSGAGVPGAGSPPAGDVLVVAHGRVVNVVAASLGAAPRRVGHLEGWLLEVDGTGARLLHPVALVGDVDPATGPTHGLASRS